MQEALDLAAEGQGRTSPNPTVGAVLVREGDIVGRGFHTWAGKDHAEIVALARRGTPPRVHALRDLGTMSHHGRTPPCTDALIHAGVAEVVAAMKDPNPQVAGQGFARLRSAGITVTIDEDKSSSAARAE